MTDIYLDDNAMTGTLPPEWSTVGQLSLTGDIDMCAPSLVVFTSLHDSISDNLY
jgi:hypothetical protein